MVVFITINGAFMKRLNVILFIVGFGFSAVLLHGMGPRFSSYFQKYYTRAGKSAQEAMEKYGPQVKDYAQKQGPKLIKRVQNLRQYGSGFAEKYGPLIKSTAVSARQAAVGAHQYVAERAPELVQKVTEKYPQASSWWGNLRSQISSYWNPAARQSAPSMVRPIEEQSVKVATEVVQRPIEPSAAYLMRRQAFIKEEVNRENLFYGRGSVTAQRVKDLQKKYDKENLARELKKQKDDADLRQYE